MFLLDLEYKHIVFIAVGLAILLTLLYRFDQRKRYHLSTPGQRKLLAYEMYMVLTILFVGSLVVLVLLKGFAFWLIVVNGLGGFYP